MKTNMQTTSICHFDQYNKTDTWEKSPFGYLQESLLCFHNWSLEYKKVKDTTVNEISPSTIYWEMVEIPFGAY